jgi:amidase
MNVIEHTPDIYHLTFGVHTPSLKIKSGQIIRVSVPDCDGLGADGMPLSDTKFEQSPYASITKANPTAGPYYIEDAERGDHITVCIHRVVPNRRLGRTGISARQINIKQKYFMTSSDADWNVLIPRKLFHWDIDVSKNVATLKLEKSKKNRVEIPLCPSVGCIAIAPDNGQYLDGMSVGNYGGNLDIPGVGDGCRIHFPVFVQGAYLFLGDIHAAQGEGEIIGGAIETSGTIEFSVLVNKQKTISWPRIEDAKNIGVIAAGTTLDEAIQIAYAQLVIWMSDEYGFDRWEALNLLSQTGHARPGNFQSASCTIAKKYVEG